MSSGKGVKQGVGTIVVGDWGTSRLRLFLIADDRIVERREGPGIGALPASPGEVLRAALVPWRRDGEPLHVTLCGMAGSRNGLAEAPYADCPVNAGDWRSRGLRCDVGDIAVTLLAGLACTNGSAATDVMRGEETQIFGAILIEPSLAAGRRQFILPGTHSKWVTVEDGAVTQFKTFFTGELFALLSERSTLAGSGDGSRDDEEKGFEAGLARAACDADLLGSLFTARASQLRSGCSGSWALGYLSGLLIGHEFRAQRPCGQVTLVGAPALTARYERALASHGITSMAMDGDACSLAGLLSHAATFSGGLERCP